MSENLKEQQHISVENHNSQQETTLSIEDIEQLFPNLTWEESQEMFFTVQTEKINKKFLLKIKKLAEKTEETPLVILKKTIQKEKNNLQEKNDLIQKEPILIARSPTILEMMNENHQNLSENNQNLSENNQELEENNQELEEYNQNFFDKEQIKTIQQNLEATFQAQKDLSSEYTNHTEAERQEKANTFSPQIKSKLENANIKLEEYASFLLSREKIGNDTSPPENEAFLKSLKNLEHSLWIPETSKGGFFRGFEPQKETFDQNPDLAKYANGSQDFSAFEKLDYFPEMMPFEEEKKLIQTFGSPALKEFSQKIAPLLTKDQHLLSEIEKQALENYQNQLKQLKYQLESKAKNFMKASATNAPISAILNYLDSESLGDQTLTDLLEKPKSWSFAQIHQEGKDQVLHFQGTIEGNPLTFYYNLSDPNATLECDDCLYQDPVSKTFTLGKSSGARTKLNIQMPTTEQLASNLSKTCSPEKFQKILKNSSTPAEYQQQLSQLISWTVEKSFSDEKLIKSRLSRHTEKNLTIQTFNSSLIPAEIMQQLTTGKQLNENPDTKRLFKLLDRTSESSTSSELQSFRSSLKKRDALLQNPDKIQKIQDPVLRSCLENCAAAKIKKSDFQAWNQSLLQFFNLFTKQEIWSEAANTDDPNYVLNLDDFAHFVDYLEKPEKKITDDQQLSSFSPHFQRKYEAQTSGSLASLEEEMEESFEFAYA